MNSAIASEISDIQAMQFFQGLKKELQCSSTQKIISLVRVVLSKLSRSFTSQQLSEIIAKTPPLFHLLFVGYWQSKDEGKELRHLDEIVVELMEEDEQAGKEFFKSEVETLVIVIIVMSKLDKLLKMVGIKPFNYTLSTELQQAV